MRFRIDLKIFVFALLFYLTKQIEAYAMIMFFAILHEFGHLFAGLMLGMKPEKMEFRPYGVSISFKLTPKDYNKKVIKGNILEIKKIIVAFAGPTVNLILIIISTYFKINIFTQLAFIYANILLILFNLLPIYPLDGGRVLKSILHILIGKKKAEELSNKISYSIAIVLTIIASIAIYFTQNISIFLIALFLWAVVLKEDIIFKRRNKIYNLVQKTIENN